VRHREAATVRCLSEEDADATIIDRTPYAKLTSYMSHSFSFWDHPIKKLEEALHIRRQIETLQRELASLFGNHPPSLDALPSKSPAVASAKKKKKPSISAEGRARIVAAQKARRVKVKAKTATVRKATAPAKAPASKVNRTLSAEARARIAAAQKARWAKVKKPKNRNLRQERQQIAEAGQPKFKIF